MDRPYFVNHFMHGLLPGNALPVMVQAAGEITEQEALSRSEGYPAYHAMLSVSGAGLLETGAGSCEVPASHVFLLAPGQPHSYSPRSGRWHTCWVVFDGPEAEVLVSGLKLAAGIPFPLSDTALFRGRYGKICDCILENSIGGIYKASAECYALLTELSFERNKEAEGAAPPYQEARIAQALEHIHANFARDVALEQMARSAGVTPQHLCRLFQNALAMTPCEYLQQYRLKKAKELLMDKSLPTGRVGALCGFQDPSYFCSVFRRHTGYTPKEFRKVFAGV